AVLLLEANQVVSRDRLIDALWGEEPPDTARNTIQVYVSQLRKLLPDDVLETAPPGYRLIVDPDAVDLFEFVRLSEEGRTALGTEPSESLRHLERAILAHDPALNVPQARPGLPRRAPIPATPLLGRERELAALADLVRDEDTRLVTLTGTGGIGKTRLALELVRRLAPEYRDGSAVAAIATLREPAHVAGAILEAL